MAKSHVRDRRSIPWWIKDQVAYKTRGLCWYCGQQPDEGSSKAYRAPQIEHQIPVRDGGTDDVENLVLSCKVCNYAKGIRSVEEFRNTMGDFVVAFCDHAIDSLVDLEWWHDNQREKETMRVLADIRDFYRGLRIDFFGEFIRHEWSDYTI